MSTDETTTESCLPGNTIREPSFQALTIDEIRRFAKSGQPNASIFNESEIATYLDHDPDMMVITKLINNLINIDKQYALLPGLTDSQRSELSTLISARKEFKKNFNRDDFDTEQVRHFLANEKKLVPLDQTVRWWNVNSLSFKKLDLWEKLSLKIIDENKKMGTPDDIVNDLLHHLTDIKNDWIKHQLFASFTSSGLVDYYRNQLCVTEEIITDLLTHKKNIPAIIRNYLQYILDKLIDIKNQVVYSMLFRLTSADFYKDIRCDDVLSYLFDKMEADCRIKVRGNGKSPSLRQGLKPAVIDDFISIIEDYCTKNQNERAILDRLNKLSFRQMPADWNYALRTRSNKSDPETDPVIRFCESNVTHLLLNISEVPNLQDILLNSEMASNEAFTLNKLQIMVNALDERINLINAHNRKISLDLREKTLEHQKKYRQFIQKIHDQLHNEMQASQRSLLEACFDASQLDPDSLKQLSEQAKHLSAFSKRFTDQNTITPSDIILTTAHQLKERLTRGEIINTKQAINIATLLSQFYSDLSEQQITKLKNNILSLASLLNENSDMNDATLLHFITHQLESALIPIEEWLTIIYRHKSIAEMHHEKWQPLPINSVDHAIAYRIQLLRSYIENVSLNIIKSTPIITLDNFNEEHFTYGIDALIHTQNDIDDAKQKKWIQTELNNIRQQYEESVFNNLHNRFAIRNYLYNKETNHLDLEKLGMLLLRSERFFTNAIVKNKMTSIIQEAAASIIKTHCIRAIENNQTIDTDIINSANELMNTNLLAQLSDDKDLTVLLKTSVDSFDGTTAMLGPILAGIFQNKMSTEQTGILSAYAQKRLDFIIASRAILPSDFLFFQNSKQHPLIATLLTEKQHQFANVITAATATPLRPWNKNTSLLIELLGSDETVRTYRTERVKQLVLSKMKSLTSTQNDHDLDDWLSTINFYRSSNQPLAPANMILHDQYRLSSFLDDYISKQPWSSWIEKMTLHFGTSAQQHHLHYQLLTRYLTTTTSYDDSWLLTQLKSVSRLKLSPTPLDNKKFYLDFIGGDYSKKLLSTIDQSLYELDKVNMSLMTKPLSQTDYATHLIMINRLLSLSDFYHAFSAQKQKSDMAEQLSTLKLKIQLHLELHSLNKQPMPQKSNDKAAELQIVTQHLNIAAQTIANHQLVNAKSISDFVQYCNSEIFSKLTVLLNHSTLNLTDDTLATLTNALSLLSSKSIAQHLFAANEHQTTQNPYWLSLINHIDDPQTLQSIEMQVTSNHDKTHFTRVFLDALDYAKNIVVIKNQVNALIKSALFREANLSTYDNKSLTLDATLASSMSDKELLHLWLASMTKLQKASIASTSKPAYASIIQNTAFISATELLTRARKNLSLFHQFEFSLVNAAPPLPSKDHRQSSLWILSDHSQIDEPMQIILRKTLALKMIFTLEEYLQTKLSKDQLSRYTTLCNDPVFKNAPTNLLTLKDKLALKRDDDAARIISTMSLYYGLNQLTHDNDDAERINQLIHELAGRASNDPVFSQSSSYKKLTRDLITLTNTNLLEDKKHEKPTWLTRLLHKSTSKSI